MSFYVRNETFSFSPQNWTSHTIEADSGDAVVSGGYALTTTITSVRVVRSSPELDRSGWTVTIDNPLTTAVDVELFAVCENLA